MLTLEPSATQQLSELTEALRRFGITARAEDLRQLAVEPEVSPELAERLA
jgi:hypothetical protein